MKLWDAARKLLVCCNALDNEKMATVVDTSASLPIAAHAASVGAAIHVAGGCGSTHASSTGANVVNLLQICQMGRHMAAQPQAVKPSMDRA